MEIDDRICSIVKTCLKEQWPVDEVTDEMVKTQIEMILLAAVMHDMDDKHLPDTENAVAEYLGVEYDEVEQPIDDEDSDFEEDFNN